MHRVLFLVPLALGLSGCAAFDRVLGPGGGHSAPAEAAPPASPSGARTAEAFDTTTAAERAAALTAQAADGTRLGTAVASLGDPSAPGFWLETPLVSATAPGRIVLPATGASVQVELRPSGGGTRISLAAMRLLGAALTDLPEIEVYSG